MELIMTAAKDDRSASTLVGRTDIMICQLQIPTTSASIFKLSQRPDKITFSRSWFVLVLRPTTGLQLLVEFHFLFNIIIVFADVDATVACGALHSWLPALGLVTNAESITWGPLAL